MKPLKIAGIAAGVLVGLLLLGGIAVAILFDPNDYKDDIERLVAQRTGRELTLSGDLSLSFFPWLAIRLGPAALSDAPGFGDEPFAQVREARLGVRLWPLLRGRVEIGEVRLDGVSVRLITDAEGRENWADLIAAEETAGSTPDAQPDEPLTLPTIAGLEIRDAGILIEDRRDDSRLVVRDFNLTTGRVESGEPFALESSFLAELSPELSVRAGIDTRVTADLERNVHELSAMALDLTLLGSGFPAEGQPVNITAATASADVGGEQYSLQDLVVKATWHDAGLPPAGIPVEMRVAALGADLAAQTLELTGLDVDAAGAKVSGALRGTEILDAPRLTGQLALAQVQMRDWLPRLGVELPTTRDPGVFGPLSLTAQVALTDTSADLSDLVLRFDDTTARGSLGLADFEAQALRFDLDVDRIDADRYLAPATETAAADPAAEEPFVIPVETLRQLNARGTLDVGEAIFAGMKFTKLRLGLTARDGDVRFDPVEAAVYGGQYRGDVGIAAAGEVPRVTMAQRFTDVDFAPLLSDLFETRRLAGKGSFNAQLAGSGRDSEQLMRTLSGNFDFRVSDGALEGADLWYEIRRARALLRQQAIPAREGPPRTAFTALQGSGTVRDGVFTTNDLNIAMQYLRVTGNAAIDVPGSRIDSRLETAVLRIPPEGADAADRELVDARIPVRITGPLADPSVRPDVEGYLKNQIRERVEEEKEKVEERVRETLQERLRRALGR